MKYLITIFIAVCLAACSSHDEQHYYRVNPKALNDALEQCPDRHPTNISCEQLNRIGEEVRGLAYEMQSNQLEFGRKIQLLQVEKANLESNMRQPDASPDLAEKLKATQRQLDMSLAVVKWLQSPEN